MAGGNDEFTKVLLHFDGADGSTTITDENVGGSAHTWTAQGDAQLDTAFAVFGSASLLLDGTGDYISTPDNADFEFGAGEFTLDCRARFNALPTGLHGTASMVLFSHYLNASRGYIFTVEKNGSNYRLKFIYNYSGGLISVAGSDFSLSTGVTYHFEVGRDNSGTDTIRLFKDGVAAGTDSGAIDARTITDSTADLWIGTYADTPQDFFNGWIDEARVSVGVCRHTVGFTPSGPYSRIAPAAMNSYRQRRAA